MRIDPSASDSEVEDAGFMPTMKSELEKKITAMAMSALSKTSRPKNDDKDDGNDKEADQ